MATVTIHRVENVDDLFCKYPGQSEPQPVELSLDIRTGDLRCDYNPEIGNATTFDHFHGLILSANIPCLTADAANELMAEVAPIAQRVLDGAEEEWDGNNNVGVLTDDAAAAWDEIADLCADQGESTQTVTWWDIPDWFSEGDEHTVGSLGITADTTDVEIGGMAVDESTRAARDSAGDFAYAVLDAGAVAAYLTYLRDGLRETVRGDLVVTAAALADARQRRDDLVRQVSGWGVDGDTWRSIGELAGGISHSSVGRIVRGTPSPTTVGGCDVCGRQGVEVRQIPGRDRHDGPLYGCVDTAACESVDLPKG